MAEYLSPGVYVEEFDSGSTPMEGVGTSTAGFVGLAQRGPTSGLPQLVTNYADFGRIYGGHLSANEFGDYRFLSYAVESFFVNGGSRCYVMRVAPPDAKASTGSAAALSFTARNPGLWGDDISISFAPASKAKTQVLEIIDDPDGKKYRVKSSVGFNAGDIVAYDEDGTVTYNKVVKSQDNIITFENDYPDSIVDTNLLPSKVITTCEFSVVVKYDDLVETYENASFNIEASNYIEKVTAKSDLIIATYNAGGAAAPAAGAKDDDEIGRAHV